MGLTAAVCVGAASRSGSGRQRAAHLTAVPCGRPGARARGRRAHRRSRRSARTCEAGHEHARRALGPRGRRAGQGARRTVVSALIVGAAAVVVALLLSARRWAALGIARARAGHPQPALPRCRRGQARAPTRRDATTRCCAGPWAPRASPDWASSRSICHRPLARERPPRASAPWSAWSSSSLLFVVNVGRVIMSPGDASELSTLRARPAATSRSATTTA